MSLYQVKQGIKAFIAGQVVIDQWSVREPSNVQKIALDSSGNNTYYPATAGIIQPVEDLTMKMDANDKVTSAATITIEVAWRYFNQASFYQLPLEEIENLIEWTNAQAIIFPRSIWDGITNISVIVQDRPVQVAPVSGEDRDWIIYGRFEWSVEFMSRPIDPNELGNVQPPLERPVEATLENLVIRTHSDDNPPINNPTLDRTINLPRW